MKATVISNITPRGYSIKLMIGDQLKKGAFIKTRLKFIILQNRWEQQAAEFNHATEKAHTYCTDNHQGQA